MREYNIKTGPVTFLDIMELRIEEEVNRHGRAVLSGHITDEQEEEYLGLLTGNVWESVQAVGKNGETRILFIGIVTDFSISRINDQRKLTLELMTGSCLMDEKTHLRSYQNMSVTYEEIFKEIMKGYADAAVSFSKPYGKKTGELVLQHAETDWTFLKRLASRSHQFLVPDSQRKGVRIYYSMPQGEPFEIPEGSRYSMRKDLSAFRNKICQGMAVSEADCMEYIIQCRESHRIGDYTSLYGKRYYIYQIKSRYEGGELLHCCCLKREKGIGVPECYNEVIAGCALSAKVTKVREDKVQVSIVGDENARQDNNVEYPYATVYSTPDGTGWYCMPEPGDKIRLYFPNEHDREAYAVSAYHEAGADLRKNHKCKFWRNREGKEIQLAPGRILLTNNNGTYIELSDADGIDIVSTGHVTLSAGETLRISSSGSSIEMSAPNKVRLKQGDTEMSLGGDLNMRGAQIKL